MQVTSMPYGKYDYQKAPMNKKVPELQGGEESFGNAVEKVEKEERGKALSITIAGKGPIGHGVRAVLLEESTPDRPIIQVTSNYNGKREFFNIDISKDSGEISTEGRDGDFAAFYAKDNGGV